MFAFIRGVIFEATPLHCILDVQGVGYKLFIPASTFGKLPASGKEILLHTSFVVRELSQHLYGFLSAQERDLFDLLIGITGVGPKLALSIIGHLSIRELQQAVSGGDNFALCRIPGIGKKTAERLIIEMRDKLKSLSSPEFATLAVHSTAQQGLSDAMSALMHLGYTQAIAQKAIQRSVDSLNENVDLATLITTALKNV
ncbi:MAG: Holliday junction branch migration protein RuvA [Parachlamydiaceae bacterium]|nr:Holliday junction branch migration protein RuvA [Parachlamydiaceae bacterium]